eukprot:1160569-Pelagomonas_calceolata.AAC.13
MEKKVTTPAGGGHSEVPPGCQSGCSEGCTKQGKSLELGTIFTIARAKTKREQPRALNAQQ